MHSHGGRLVQLCIYLGQAGAVANYQQHLSKGCHLVTDQLTSHILEKEAMYSACFCTSRELRGPRSTGVTAWRVAISRCLAPGKGLNWLTAECSQQLPEDLTAKFC